MTDLPDSLDARPKDRRGLPIPAANYVDEAGVVDFTVVDGNKTYALAQQRKCGLCATRLDYWVAFLGGPRSASTRTYVDPPMHPACAEAATRLCPHIARRDPKRSKKPGVNTVTPGGFALDKPEQWVMGVTRSYTVAVRAGSVIFTPAPFRWTRQFVYDTDGALVEQVQSADAGQAK